MARCSLLLGPDGDAFYAFVHLCKWIIARLAICPIAQVYADWHFLAGGNRCAGLLSCPDQGQCGYCGTFASTGLKEVSYGCFGFIQPIGRSLSGESCHWIVIGTVALVLEVGEELGEDLGVHRQSGSVLLQLDSGLVVVEATVYLNPGVSC
jgi:hypothetical protein